MFDRGFPSVLAAGLLGVAGVFAGPVAMPVYLGEKYALRSLEMNRAAGNSCNMTVPAPDLSKRAVNLGTRAPEDDCKPFQCGSYNVILKNRIGRGGFGVVYKGVARGPDGPEFDVAVKTCYVGQDADDRSAGNAPRSPSLPSISWPRTTWSHDYPKCPSLEEDPDPPCLKGSKSQKTLYDKQSEHIALLYDVCKIEGTLYMVQELLTSDLHTVIEGGRYENDNLAAVNDYSQLLSVMSFMESESWAHGDLKPENIMFNSEGTLKLIDFDLATSHHTIRGQCGTRRYEPPEMLHHRVFTHPINNDHWALGLILFEMFTKQLPFTYAWSDEAEAFLALSPEDAAQKMHEKIPEAPETLYTILARILRKEDDRASISEIQEAINKLKDEFSEGGAETDIAKGALGAGPRGRIYGWDN